MWSLGRVQGICNEFSEITIAGFHDMSLNFASLNVLHTSKANRQGKLSVLSVRCFALEIKQFEIWSKRFTRFVVPGVQATRNLATKNICFFI